MKTRRKYIKLRKSDHQHRDCAFCDDPGLNGRTIQETETMIVVPNRTSYDFFEGLRVTEHLMIIPKRHVELIKDFTQKEKTELMELMGEYEAKNYNIYARGSGNIMRSVKHQHTHLIKLENKLSKFSVFIRKPYILLHK